jgi:hypothetical protein
VTKSQTMTKLSVTWLCECSVGIHQEIRLSMENLLEQLHVNKRVELLKRHDKQGTGEALCKLQREQLREFQHLQEVHLEQEWVASGRHLLHAFHNLAVARWHHYVTPRAWHSGASPVGLTARSRHIHTDHIPAGPYVRLFRPGQSV